MSFSFPLIAVLCQGNKPPSYLLTPPLLPVLETIDHSVAILWTRHSQTAEQKRNFKGKEGGCAWLGRGRGERRWQALGKGSPEGEPVGLAGGNKGFSRCLHVGCVG